MILIARGLRGAPAARTVRCARQARGSSATGVLPPERRARALRVTCAGLRTVPVRTMSARRGRLQKVSAAVPGHALRTGTVRGPAGQCRDATELGAPLSVNLRQRSFLW